MTEPSFHPPYEQMVYVQWHDAHGGPDGWHEITDLDRDPYVCHTVGWLVPNYKPGHLTVVGTWTNHDKIDDDSCIPLGMVRRCWSLTANVVLPVEPAE